MTTHFRLASLSAGMMTASDSSSSSCFNTDGAFMVTLLSRTVAPRFLPVTKVNKNCRLRSHETQLKHFLSGILDS